MFYGSLNIMSANGGTLTDKLLPCDVVQVKQDLDKLLPLNTQWEGATHWGEERGVMGGVIRFLKVYSDFCAWVPMVYTKVYLEEVVDL